MTRPLRIEFSGALYHITSRGNGRKNIFRNDSDRNDFLRILGLTIKRYHWLCHTYCLMDNHYHLLIETPESNLSAGMRQLNGVYTQRFNFMHKTVGHLFQGRYKAFLVEKDIYLLEVARYIVLNPVRAKIVKFPNEWKWCSYLATTGKCNIPSWLTVDWILCFFDKRIMSAQKQFRKFIHNGIGKKNPFNDVQEGMILGFPQFVDWVREMQDEARFIKEVPREQRFIGRPTLDDLFSQEILEDKKLRNDLIRLAHIQVGYTQKKIAEHIGLHYTWVSKIINGKAKL